MNHTRPWERVRVQFVPEGESLTEQGHAATCDINNIVLRHTRAGGLPPPEVPLQFGDVTALQADLTERLNFAAKVLTDVQGFLDTRAQQTPATDAAITPASFTPPENPAT